MSEEKINMELSKEFVQKLFETANMAQPSEITENNLVEALNKIKEKLGQSSVQTTASAETQQNSHALSSASLAGSFDFEDSPGKNSVLVVDDLGVIVYQLEILFKKMGFNVTTSNEVHDTIAKFKKKDFGYVVMDLFIPTEKEGFFLLDELKKLILLCKLNTKIIVMTASSKAEYKLLCKNKGADFYLEKTQGWQKELIEICKA